MTAWADYRQEVFGDPYLVWHDGPDFTEIARRYAEDPDTVLAMLRLGIAESDQVAAQACRHLDASDEQRPAIIALLQEALGPSYGSTSTEIAASLHALDAGPADELSAEIVRVLHSAAHWGVRLDAARRLAEFDPTPQLVAAVAEGVRDEDYLVRYHSADTLRHWAGVEGEISEDDDLFGLLLDGAGPDGWTELAERLSAAVRT